MKRKRSMYYVHIHMKFGEIVGMTNKTSSGFIIHFPTCKAEILSACQRFIHPLFPFLANLARSFKAKPHHKAKFMMIGERIVKPMKELCSKDKNLLSQISEGSEKNKNISQQVNGQAINLCLNFH